MSFFIRTDDKIYLIGCGILAKEIEFLIKKNGWLLKTSFLDSSLHTNFNKLYKNLTTSLKREEGKNIVVFYGCCHPLMDKILEDANTFRTEGQNCVDILLGYELFFQELCKGAFFLLEEWAVRWDQIMNVFINKEILQDIFKGDRKYILCIRTPCSKDFTAEALKAANMVGLPIRWIDVSLDHLESVIKNTITKKMKMLSQKRLNMHYERDDIHICG